MILLQFLKTVIPFTTLVVKFVDDEDKDNVGTNGGFETFTATSIVSASVPSVNIKVAVPLEVKTTGIGP